MAGLHRSLAGRHSGGWRASSPKTPTGSHSPAATSRKAQLEDREWAPLFLETSRPGVFAVGDVRSGSVKRAATAIGEGSMAVRLVFERLQVTGTVVADPPRTDTDSRDAAVPAAKLVI